MLPLSEVEEVIGPYDANIGKVRCQERYGIGVVDIAADYRRRERTQASTTSSRRFMGITSVYKDLSAF